MRVVIIVLALVLAACEKPAKKPIRLYPALATVIPSDTRLLAGVQVEKLKKTAFWKRLVEERKHPAIDRFAEERGIDPRRDIYELVFATNGEKEGAESVVLASGKFATQKSFLGQSTKEMQPHTQIQGDRMANIPYRGQVLIGNENASLWFVNNATAIAGRTSALRRVIDLRDKAPLPPQPLLDAIGTLPVDDHFWFVSTLPIDRTLPAFNVGQFGRMKSIPVKVDRILGSGNFTDGLRLKARLESSDAKSLEQMNGALRGLIGIGRLATPGDQPEMLSFYDSIQVLREAGAIRIEMKVPDDLVDRFLEAATISSRPGSRSRD